VPQLDRDGVRIRYDVAGTGPAVLFTHGFAASSRMFAANGERLAADHTVVTWDMRGHGDSDYPADPAAYSVPLAVGDMTALLDRIAAPSAVIAGHSLGGFLSLAFHLAHPERTRALILIGTGPGYRRDDGRARWNRMVEEYATGFAARGLDALPDSEELRRGAHRDASGLVLAARGILAQHDARVIDALPTIRVPTLIVVGARDAQFLDGSRYMAAKIPGATLEVIEGAGHAPNVTAAAVFDARVHAFLRRVG
jgi:pimeloyl-ACP methyl ester carboxylesterase